MADNSKPQQENNQQREAREADELYHRKKAGKAGQLWSIEVLYNYEQETKRHVIRNRYSNELMKFRETIVMAGLMLPVREEKGEYIVVLPWHIVSITVTRQQRFFDASN